MRITGVAALAAGVALATLVTIPSANAQDMRGMQVARQAMMRSNGAHMGVIGAFNEGGITDPKLVESAAGAINRIAKALPAVFPPGSGVEAGATRAKAEIWTDWDGFLAAAQALDTTSAALVEAAKSGNAEAIAAAAGAIGGEAFGACHGKYRGPRN